MHNDFIELFLGQAVVLAYLAVTTCWAAVIPLTFHDYGEEPVLSTFREVAYEVTRNADGTYQFYFTLPQQAREEARDADGKVSDRGRR